jgi:hypothetical protein
MVLCFGNWRRYVDSRMRLKEMGRKAIRIPGHPQRHNQNLKCVPRHRRRSLTLSCTRFRELGVYPNSLKKWRQEHRADPQHASPGEGQQKPEAAEMTALRRVVTMLRMERDILKGAAACFAREST